MFKYLQDFTLSSLSSMKLCLSTRDNFSLRDTLFYCWDSLSRERNFTDVLWNIFQEDRVSWDNFWPTFTEIWVDRLSWDVIDTNIIFVHSNISCFFVLTLWCFHNYEIAQGQNIHWFCRHSTIPWNNFVGLNVHWLTMIW